MQALNRLLVVGDGKRMAVRVRAFLLEQELKAVVNLAKRFETFDVVFLLSSFETDQRRALNTYQNESKILD